MGEWRFTRNCLKLHEISYHLSYRRQFPPVLQAELSMPLVVSLLHFSPQAWVFHRFYWYPDLHSPTTIMCAHFFALSKYKGFYRAGMWLGCEFIDRCKTSMFPDSQLKYCGALSNSWFLGSKIAADHLHIEDIPQILLHYASCTYSNVEVKLWDLQETCNRKPSQSDD